MFRDSNTEFAFYLWGGIAIAALAIVVLSMTAPEDQEYRRILADQGIPAARLTGYQWFGCDKNDLYNTGFTGVNANGRSVSGIVCKGILKGYTVRYF